MKKTLYLKKETLEDLNPKQASYGVGGNLDSSNAGCTTTCLPTPICFLSSVVPCPMKSAVVTCELNTTTECMA